MHERACNRCKPLVMLLAWLLPASAGAACESPEQRAFDFWLGAWIVTAADGSRAGRNEIRSVQDGCVLLEQWTGAQGGTGMSMNFYDPAAGRWRQVWASPGTQIDIRGGPVGAGMVLEGTITYLEDGRSHGFRGTWTPLPDGRVRQFFEEAAEPGRWTAWFEGFYARADAGAPMP